MSLNETEHTTETIDGDKFYVSMTDRATWICIGHPGSCASMLLDNVDAIKLAHAILKMEKEH